jgi:hypothetical protein
MKAKPANMHMPGTEKKSLKQLKIKIVALPPRPGIIADSNLVSKEGERCLRDCDCESGFICKDGICTAK